MLMLPVLLLLLENQPNAARCYVAELFTYSLIEHNQGPLPLLRLLSLLLMLLAVLVVLPLLLAVQLMLSLVLLLFMLFLVLLLLLLLLCCCCRYCCGLSISTSHQLCSDMIFIHDCLQVLEHKWQHVLRMSA